MSLVPKWPFVAAALVVGLAVGAGGMHVWDASTIAGLKVDMANLKAKQAEDVSIASQAALKDFVEATDKIKDAAQAGQVSYTALSSKLDTLNRKYNAKPPTVLSADCRPGAVRVQHLTESAAAVDASIAR